MITKKQKGFFQCVQSKMRKLVGFMLCLVLMLILLPELSPTVSAAAVDITDKFVDGSFQVSVYEVIGKEPGDRIYDTDVASISELYVSKRSITSLEGIEYFTSLNTLWCEDNLLVSLDVSKNTALRWLYCEYNQLTSLDVSGCLLLESLFCSFNQLSSLDVTNNTSLTQLWCPSNLLTSLDTSKNTELIGLVCWENQLTSLDLSNNTALEFVTCGVNRLTSLDVSKNVVLNQLNCEYNRLTSLDVSNNTMLEELICSENHMLEEPIGVKNIELYISTPQNVEDITYTIADAEFKSAVYQVIGKKPASRLYNFDVMYLESLDVSDKNINSLDAIEYFTGLVSFDCSNNNITELNLNTITELKTLDCSGNQLTALHINGATSLEMLNCQDNVLAELDVSNNTALRELDCSRNQLTTLYIGNAKNLETLDCSYNRLNMIDISQNDALRTFNCSYNWMWQQPENMSDGVEYVFVPQFQYLIIIGVGVVLIFIIGIIITISSVRKMKRRALKKMEVHDLE